MFEMNVIFGYAFTPNEGCYGVDDGGFSVELYEDGAFVHKTYVFDFLEKTRKEYAITSDIVEKIKKALFEITRRCYKKKKTELSLGFSFFSL